MQRRSLAQARCEHAWRTQRPQNDWAGFLANFREVLAIAREEARRLAAQQGCRPLVYLTYHTEGGDGVATA